MLADLRLAARALLRARAATAVAVLTLALGVGANAALFGLVDRLLLRPTPGVADPGRVARVYGRNGWTAPTRSYADYLDLGGARALAAVAAYQSGEAVVRRPARAAVRVERVTAGYLPLLGARPRLGRGFTADEERGGGAPGAGGARVAVVSDALSRRLFGGGPAALGRDLVIGRDAYRVVGVAPPAFRGADAAPADVWLPLGVLPRDRGNYGAVHVVARLRPGAALADADREANQLNRRGYAADGLRATEDVMRLGPLAVAQGPAAPPEVRVALWLAAVAGLVLVIAAANVAHLLVARGLAREGETAVRAALGATRARLARAWLAEGALLGAASAAAALGVAAAAGPAVARLAAPDVAAAAGWGGGAFVSARVVAAAAVLAAAAGLACGAAAALHAGGRGLAGALAGGARLGSRGRTRLRAALLATQVALTAVLLVGAGLFARSLRNVRGLDLGVDVDRLLVVRVNGQDAGLSEGAADTLLRRMAERARLVPGVEAAAAAHTVPFVSAWRTRFYVPGRDPERWGNEGGGRFNFLSTFVGPEYAEAVGLRLLGGRWLGAGDRSGAEPVAVVNGAFAREVWPGEAPAAAVGRCLRLMTPGAPCTRVVGVVADARAEGVFEAPPAQYYLALAQPRRGEGATALLVRAAGASAAERAQAADRVRRALQPLAPEAADVEARPLAAAVDPVRRPWLLGASVFGGFGLLALAVAASGLYGVVTLLVQERTREIGVRRALGARGGDVARLVGARVGRVAAGGLAAGLALGWAGSRAAAGLLYGVGPLDPAAYAGAAALLAAAAVVAAAAPVRRAARVDPVATLRAG